MTNKRKRDMIRKMKKYNTLEPNKTNKKKLITMTDIAIDVIVLNNESKKNQKTTKKRI